MIFDLVLLHFNPCLVLNLRGASSDLEPEMSNDHSDDRNADQEEQKKPVRWKLWSVRPSFPACEARTSPWAVPWRTGDVDDQAVQSTGWIISGQSRDQAVQSTGWIISGQSQFFRSCSLRTSPWGCWGPLTYRWWSGSGSTLGSCPAVGWGSSEPTMYEFSRDGGIQTKQANKSPGISTSGHAMQRRSTSVLAVQRCPPTVHTVQRCPTPGLAVQRCPPSVPVVQRCPPSVLVCRDVRLQFMLSRDVRLQSIQSRRTFTRSSWRTRMLPRRSWRMLPRRSWRRRRWEPR